MSFLHARCAGAFALAMLATLSATACKSHGSDASDPGAREGVAPSAAASGLPPPPDMAAPPDDAIVTASGLASKVLASGTGTQHPDPNAVVRVNYTGWTADGTMIDSSLAPQKPGREAHPV